MGNSEGVLTPSLRGREPSEQTATVTLKRHDHVLPVRTGHLMQQPPVSPDSNGKPSRFPVQLACHEAL